MPEEETPKDPVPGMLAAFDQINEILKPTSVALGKYDTALIQEGIKEPIVRGPLVLDLQKRLLGQGGLNS